MIFLANSFLFLHDLMRLLQCTERISNHYCNNLLLLFCFYPIRRIYIWSTTFKNHFMTFIVQQTKRIKYKITTSHRCFYPDLMSIKKWFKKLFDNFICFIITHDFYVVTLWMRYTLFIIVFWGHKVNCYC